MGALDQRLVNELQQAVRDPDRALRPLGRPLGDAYRYWPPATPEQLAESQGRLGFQLPHAVRQLYTQVANGGFGPAYGVLGLVGGAPDEMDETAVDSYLGRRQEPWPWPKYLLPFCNWGCLIYSCVDCRPDSDTVRVIRVDPNGIDDDDPATLAAAFRDEGYTLDGWLQAWLDGGDEAMFYLGEQPGTGQQHAVAKLLSTLTDRPATP
jgi:SMI1 / KNR4 family (SUKH-1)